jgi:hypothetical protein
MVDHVATDEPSAAQAKPPRLTRIYALKDPRDGLVRYVGKTVAPIHIRLSNHISAAVKDGKDTYVCRWIRLLNAAGIRPIAEHIETVGDGWAEREAYWIGWHRAQGALLTNVTLGGEGSLGWRHSPEVKALIGAAAKATAQRMALAGIKRASFSAESRALIAANSRGRTHTAESRALIGAAHRGMKHTAEALAKMSEASKGRVISPEHRAIISALHTGKVNSAETRARMSIAQTGRVHSDETRERIRAARLGTVASDETRARLSAAKRGHAVTAETRERLRIVKTGGVHSPQSIARMVEAKKNISPETRAKMSAGQKRRFGKPEPPSK